jgi:hypothetical protein
MKKIKGKGWVEDVPEYDPDEQELDLDLPALPQLKKKSKKKVKKVDLNGDPEGNNLRNKISTKRRINIR